MGPEATHLAASVAKSMEPERLPNATQRASDVSQGQLSAEAISALSQKKTDAAEQARRNRIRQERERRRHELERHGLHPDDSSRDAADETGPSLDVVV